VTAGFASNQVSSAFGLGFFIMFVAWFQNWRLTGSKILDGTIALLFLFQAIMTFSRGGVLGGFLGVIVVVLLIMFNRSKEVNMRNRKKIGYLLLTTISFLLIFLVADGITNGMISNRYRGETAGTLDGTKEQTFNNITSNRFDIFTGDLEIWSQYPLFGSGVGASRYLRSTVNGVIAHVELSRLAAEHGALGFFYFLLLLSVGLSVMAKNIRLGHVYNYLLFGFFIIGLFTTFHAATRTFISPLLIGISCLSIPNAINKK
jgi:hypothetical protein